MGKFDIPRSISTSFLYALRESSAESNDKFDINEEAIKSSLLIAYELKSKSRGHSSSHTPHNHLLSLNIYYKLNYNYYILKLKIYINR
jgi:hypothetical protein